MPTEDTSRLESFSVCLSGLSEVQLARVRHALPDLDWIVQSSQSGPIARCPLSPHTDYGTLSAFLDVEALDPAQVTVVISVATSSDHSGVSVPDNVMEVIRRARCGVTFSIVACLAPPFGEEELDDTGSARDVKPSKDAPM